MTRSGRRVLILVENLPVPFDRRVWQEARELHDAGYSVCVVSPAAPGYPAGIEIIEGVTVARYRAAREGNGVVGFAVEYVVALVSMMVFGLWLARQGRFHVVHACNPPDLMFLPALPHIALGAVFVFDHHDLSPELLQAKGHSRNSRVVRLSLAFERITFRLAKVSIATNETYRRLAIERGRMAPEDVFVVRSAPDTKRFAGAVPDDRWRGGRRYLIAYVGVMGIQEGLTYLLEAVRSLRDDFGVQDVRVVLAGDGPDRHRAEELAVDVGVDDMVAFVGRISDEELASLLISADVCVNPDEVNTMNNVSTMNKIVEYMAVGRPIVQFETLEGQFSAGESSLYAEANDACSFAAKIAELLAEPELRERMGRAGQRRFAEHLSWDKQVPRLLAAYRRALGD